MRRRARTLGVGYHFLFIEPDGDALQTLTRLVVDGVLKPVVDRVLPFEQTPEALQRVLAGGTRGKILATTRTVAGKAAARDYLSRIGARQMDRDQPMALRSFNQQISAIRRCGSQRPHDLSKITAPTLIANGDHDRMVPSGLSVDMHGRIPNSTPVFYPDAGHGGVFQNQHFTQALLGHLDV